MNQTELRSAIRKANLRDRFYLDDGARVALSVADLQILHDRVVQSCSGWKNIWDWWTSAGQEDAQTQQTGVFFWWDMSASRAMPEVARAGLKSAMLRANFRAELITYPAKSGSLWLTDLVDEFVSEHLPFAVVDASKYLQYAEFLELVKLYSLTHVSESLRLLHISDSNKSGWMLDCDTLWLRPPPLPLEKAAGHIFGSMKSDPRRGTARATATFWHVNYLSTQNDKLLGIPPLRFPRKSPVLAEVIDACSAIMWTKKMPPSHPNWIMDIIWAAVRNHGLCFAFLPATSFSPVSANCQDSSCLRAASFQRDLFNEIASSSYAINCFWQTCKEADINGTALVRGSLARAEIGSLWRELTMHALPELREVPRFRLGSKQKRRRSEPTAGPVSSQKVHKWFLRRLSDMRTFSLPCILGKHQRSDVVIDHLQVSNTQVLVTWGSDGLPVLKDYSAVRNTYLNDVRVERGTITPVRDGDVIRLTHSTPASTALQFSLHLHAE